MPVLPHRPLGSSGLEVSVFALGSWRTFERIPREQGLAVMRAAARRRHHVPRRRPVQRRDRRRHRSQPATREILFGELFRDAGWVRDEVVVSNKLWWEFWPEQDAAAELDSSLGRMGLDHIDLIYTMQPPEGLTIAELVEQVAALVASGRARVVGHRQLAGCRADRGGAGGTRRSASPLPAAAQLPYSLVRADWVQDPAMEAVLADADIGLVASYVLAGGTLTGKYLQRRVGTRRRRHHRRRRRRKGACRSRWSSWPASGT